MTMCLPGLIFDLGSFANVVINIATSHHEDAKHKKKKKPHFQLDTYFTDINKNHLGKAQADRPLKLSITRFKSVF